MSYNLSGWIIGTGPIGQEYAKILTHLGISFDAIGRSDTSVSSFISATGHKAVGGGITDFLKTKPPKPDFAIIATTVNQLAPTASRILDYGIQKILLEKPGGMNRTEIEKLHSKARDKNIYIAYNRRHLASTHKALEIIKDDGGVRSFHFDFTEWPSRILSFEHAEGILENWFYMNSTHIVDLAFYLGGWPMEINCQQSGFLEWHKPSAFAGSGKSENGAVFSYNADWESAGRWSVEISTPKRKLIFAPIEKLKEQRHNDINIYDIPLNDDYDQKFKPGFFLQTKEFLKAEPSLLNLKDQIKHWSIFNKMAGSA